MAAYSTYRDIALWHRVQESDIPAYTELYERYRGVLYVHALRMLKEEDEAHDVVQDLFIHLWEKREELEIRSSFSSYIYTSIRNRILDVMAKQKHRWKYINSLQSHLDEGIFETEERVHEQELARIIEREVAHLPQKMREIFHMSREENLSHKEIALALNLSDKTVKKQVSNALTILRKKIDMAFPIIILLIHLLLSSSPAVLV